MIEGEVKVTYPCNWKYSLISRDKDQMTAVIRGVVGSKDHKISESNRSKSGKFVSLHLEVMVFSDDERIYIYEELKNSKAFLHIL